ncbi:MAG: type II toxin-antitoxin system VapC family toxin [Desulfobacteria bacterium]|nr:PIN domain-containing protein [Thermodesulfobacteriota bacterium]
MLVDTSAWIEFFRKKEPYHTAVLGLIDEDRVFCAGIILGELLQGAKSDKELEVLKDFLHVFEFVSETSDLWEKAGELSFALRRKGNPVGLSDCFIAVAAMAYDAEIISLDKHFGILKKEIRVNVTRL